MSIRFFIFLTICIALGSAVVDVSFEELSKGIADGSLIYIDVRNPSELLEDGKIPGSFNIPSPELREAFLMSENDFSNKYGLRKPLKEADSVVIGCRSGKRAAKAIELLDGMGYTKFKIYTGSFLDWVAKGGEIVRD